jgi:hypothetical protein
MFGAPGVPAPDPLPPDPEPEPEPEPEPPVPVVAVDVGATVGSTLGDSLGSSLGASVGCSLGAVLGPALDEASGCCVPGCALGEESASSPERVSAVPMPIANTPKTSTQRAVRRRRVGTPLFHHQPDTPPRKRAAMITSCQTSGTGHA